MKRVSIRKLRGLAHHEAAHAVVALALGSIFVHEIKLEGRKGQTTWAAYGLSPLAIAQITMAGSLATSEYLRKPGRIRGTDAAAVRELIAAGLPCSRRACREATRRLVRKHWQAIKAVAAELVCVGRISGERLDQIIDGARR